MTSSVLPVSGADVFAAAFDRVATDAPVPESVQAFRRASLDSFAALGYPTTKNEDWHYTSVARLSEEEWLPTTTPTGDVSASDLTPFLFGDDRWHLAVFVNGRFSPSLSRLGSLPKGVEVRSLVDAFEQSPEVCDQVGTIATGETHAFTALNGAFVYDGAVVRIGANVEVEHPIHIVFVTDAHAAKSLIQPRTLITVERQAKAAVIESYVSTSNAVYFTNAVTEVRVANGATLAHYKVQRESKRAFHIGTADVKQGRDSHYVSFSFATGGDLSRTNVYTSLDGAGCGATLNGLYLLDEAQHCDHQTAIVHAQPNCYSRELYKGILDGRSHGVFNGKVYVHPIAQKTDGKQTNNTLLLSDEAQIDTKPQLEIFADDVKCTHGATVGQIDRQALFYMKSRGVSGESARRLLTYAFAADVLETLEIEPVKLALEELTMQRYAGQPAE